MVDNHLDVSSEDEELNNEAEQGNLDEPVSNKENGPIPADEGGNELVEDGLLMETHGGGTLESVPGFCEFGAMTEGFRSELKELTEEQKTARPCCEIEFDKPESVCGRDDRVRIRSTSRIPWRCVCQLLITLKNGRRSRCTGWFIGSRTVMTAGHCVYSHRLNDWAKQIEVIPGMDTSRRPFGSVVGESFRSVKGWTVRSKSDYDYGAIILPDKTLGERVGWFGFACLSSKSLMNLLVNNAGYAGDKPFGTLWFNAGRITKVEERQLQYMIDTYGGHSGSPVWRLRNGKYHAVGIHAYGGCPNKSTRIVKPVFLNMKKWKDLGS